MTTYKGVHGSLVTDEKAQRYGEYLEKVVRTTGGINAEALVELRHEPEIADWFEHDDIKAAHKHRKWQAYNLLININKVLELPNGEEVEVRAFHNMQVTLVRDGEKEPREMLVKIYKNIDEVLANEDFRQQMVEQALEEFRSRRNKYQHLKELAGIFAAIDAT